MLIAIAILVVLFMGLSWATNFLGFPGNWVIAAVATVYWFLLPAGQSVAISWQLLVALVAIAMIGEVIEFAAGALGTATAGGSKRGAALAMLGSIVGGIAGLLIGVPIPVVGPLVAALFFACLGAMAGAAIGEIWKGRATAESLKVGYAAFWARLWGTAGKLACGAIMIVAMIAGIIF